MMLEKIYSKWLSIQPLSEADQNKLSMRFTVEWRKRSIPTHSEWLYPLTFDAGKGLKEA